MESDIPFPLLAGQYFSTVINGNKRYFKIQGQPKMFDLTYAYEIGPGLQLKDETITQGTGSGTLSVFRTNFLKEWVTWIDNKYLEVEWMIDNKRLTSLDSFTQPLTSLISPFGSTNFPLFIYNNVAGNVTFSLTNNSTVQTISGKLHIIMYDYSTESVRETPAIYTDIDYMGRS